MLALTATATPEVMEDIALSLQLRWGINVICLIIWLIIIDELTTQVINVIWLIIN